MIFSDRNDAGQQLAQHLQAYHKHKNAIVLGLARGGVVVAYEVAKALSLPLNALVPRKIGAPGNPELAIGAVAENGALVLNSALAESVGASEHYIHEEAAKQKAVAQERLALFRRAAPLPNLRGKTVILVDDGVATGATMLVEIQALRAQAARRIVAAVPVAAASSWQAIQNAADEAIALIVSEELFSISQFYINFAQVENETVVSLLTALGCGVASPDP